MSDAKLILFIAILTFTAIYMSPDGFYGRWCSAHPEFCDQEGEQYAQSDE